MQLDKTITVVLEQSARDKGAATKTTIKYDEVIQGKSQCRTVYVDQQQLLRAFGGFPKRIILHILNGDAQNA